VKQCSATVELQSLEPSQPDISPANDETIALRFDVRYLNHTVDNEEWLAAARGRRELA
jgi:hypothetical protein